MKETANMILVGVNWVLFKNIALPLLKQIIELSEKSRDEAVNKGKFTEHEFGKGLASLTNVVTAIHNADYEHYKVTKRLIKKGVVMCSKQEFKDAYMKENSTQARNAAVRNGPHR